MNFTKHFILPILFFLLFQTAAAQIDSLFVEKYYISDTKDATDLTGGGIQPGTFTYRVYVDLAPGSKLVKIFGSEDHLLKIESTSVFFNNIARGRSFGREIRVNRLRENTVALDTWITIGLASESHYGLVKAEDTNGSVVGGVNNDGGSAQIAGGLLVNSDPEAGIPLITSDGLSPVSVFPENWVARLNGMDLTSSSDTTIFGNLKPSDSFISNDFFLKNNGTSGITGNNRVLIAQLTTSGELTFSLNLEVEENIGSSPQIVRYVAENPLEGEKTTRFLTYPAPPPPPVPCGCTDPDYIEYNKTLTCHVQDSCKTLIVYGCMDTRACNFDPKATFNIQSLCCYPGKCNNRDIKIVCPGLQQTILGMIIYPVPAIDHITAKISGGKDKNFYYNIYDSNGTAVLMDNLGRISDAFVHDIDISCLPKGRYLIRLFSDSESIVKSFIKF